MGSFSSSTFLCSNWEKFLLAYRVPVDHFSIQSVNQKVFEKILLREFSQGVAPAAASVSPNLDSLSKDELNVLQYACGYVPQHLLKKFQKRSGSKYDQFVQCLRQMADCGDNEEDFLAYTKHWIDKVNRGGLFKLSNNTFNFFACIEVQVQRLLPSFMEKAESDSSTFKEAIVKKIAKCEDVEWNWTLLSQCIDTESDAIELLENIVNLWVTVRGHSITAAWLEVHKATQKKAALRKTLQKT